MEGRHIQSLPELMADHEEERKAFIKKALVGKAKWGAWRYNPDNLSLEIDSEVSGYPKDNPYYVDLERCNTSDGVLDCLLQLLEKSWCPKEQVGYLLQAISNLADDLHRVIGNRRFNMGKHLRNMRREGNEKLLKVEEVANTLRLGRLAVYRMIKDEKIRAIRLPNGKLRIPEEELNKLLGKGITEDKGE